MIWYFDLLIIILLFCIAILMHEYGHKRTLQHYIEEKVKVRFRKGEFIVGQECQYNRLDQQQYGNVLGMGILWGLPPILISPLFVGIMWFILLLVMYGLGCKSDLQLISEIIKGDRK